MSVSCTQITLESSDGGGGNGGDGGDGGDGGNGVEGDGWIVLNIDSTPPPPWEVGNVVQVSVDMENFGGFQGSTTRNVLVNGSVVDSVTVSGPEGVVDAGVTSVEVPNAAEMVVGIEDSGAEIDGIIEKPEPSISIVGCNLPGEGQTIPRFEATEVEVTLENSGNAPGTVTVTIIAGGATIDSYQVHLDVGETDTTPTAFRPGDFGLSGSVPVEAQLTGGDVLDTDAGLSFI